MAIYNEFSRLNQVVLGISPKIYAAFDLPEKMAVGIDIFSKIENKLLSLLFKKRPLPEFITSMLISELDAFEKVLLENNVDVIGPEPIEPLDNEHPGLIQMFARDPVFIVGNKVIVSRMAINMRKKEPRGFDKILRSLDNKGYEIIHMPPGDSLILEGGDVIIDHPYIYVGVGTYVSTLEGTRWLQGIVKDEFEVIPVEIRDKTIMHLDCCMTIIGKNRGIIHRDSLSNLPVHFKGYDFIEVDSKTRCQLGTNIFAINPESLVVQKRHDALITGLRERGYKVFPVDFSWHARFHGAFRCATCPLDRID